jgi:hypothetical protein
MHPFVFYQLAQGIRPDFSPEEGVAALHFSLYRIISQYGLAGKIKIGVSIEPNFRSAGSIDTNARRNEEG